MHRIELWVAECDHDNDTYAQHVTREGDTTEITITDMIGCALSFATSSDARVFCETYEGFHVRGVFFNREFLI